MTNCSFCGHFSKNQTCDHCESYIDNALRVDRLTRYVANLRSDCRKLADNPGDLQNVVLKLREIAWREV